MTIEIYKDGAKEWRFRFKAANGEIVAVGESYKRKRGAKDAVRAIAKAIKSDDYEIKQVK